ncbi:hypothetical protein U3516DRAFT_741627 [Neocallimastix sp. 'constans']
MSFCKTIYFFYGYWTDKPYVTLEVLLFQFYFMLAETGFILVGATTHGFFYLTKFKHKI